MKTKFHILQKVFTVEANQIIEEEIRQIQINTSITPSSTTTNIVYYLSVLNGIRGNKLIRQENEIFSMEEGLMNTLRNKG